MPCFRVRPRRRAAPWLALWDCVVTLWTFAESALIGSLINYMAAVPALISACLYIQLIISPQMASALHIQHVAQLECFGAVLGCCQDIYDQFPTSVTKGFSLL